MKYYTNNSFSHMQALKGGQVSLKYPQKLYLDLTQDCNMNCIMCRDKISVSGKTMNLDLYKKIVDETASYVSSYSLKFPTSESELNLEKQYFDLQNNTRIVLSVVK